MHVSSADGARFWGKRVETQGVGLGGEAQLGSAWGRGSIAGFEAGIWVDGRGGSLTKLRKGRERMNELEYK